MFTALALSIALSNTLAQTPPPPREVTLPTEPGALAGTLIEAGEGAPAAVIIAGSGPTDRNGDSALGVDSGYLRQLAEGLAEEGIASLRYDKRGVAASASAMIAEEDLRFDHFVGDARAWAAFLREETGQSCVWLIGHSEGAAIAQSAAVDNADVCGLVLIAGAGRPAAVVVREQLAGAPEAWLALLDEMAAGRTVECPALLNSLCRASVQPYVISWMQVDPAALAAAEARPMLIVQGTTDLQTTETDARALAAANENADLVLLDGVNHVLKAAPLDRAANLATYADPALPLDARVVPAVAGFILNPPG